MMRLEFGSLFHFIRNGMSIKQDKSGDGLPVTRIETISNATVDGSRVGFAGLAEEDCRGWILQPGDILFSHINSVEHIGKCAVYRGVPEKLVHGMNLLCLRADQSKVLPEYAKFVIRSNEFRARLARFVNKAVNQASVSIGNLRTIPVEIPPLAAQQRIVGVLDKADALRAKRRAALTQLDALPQSIFIDMFGDPATNPKGYEQVPISALVRKDDSINYGVVQPGDDIAQGVPLIRVSDLVDGRVTHNSLKRINPKIEAAYGRSRLRGDEILVSCVGSIGVIALADPSVKGFNIARAVARIPLGNPADRGFVATYLCTSFVQRYFTSELRTVSQPTLNIKQLSETIVVLPPASLRSAFADRVVAIEKLKTAARAANAELDALFVSVQHRAFRGDL